MNPRHPLLQTCDQIVQEELPNLFRLYVNPHVTQACFCLARYVQSTWKVTHDFQTFLANGFDEALSGAIKLARYGASQADRPTTGLVLDPGDRLGPFAAVTVTDGQTIEFIPGITIVRGRQDFPADVRCGFVVLVASVDHPLDGFAEPVRAFIARDKPIVITCIDRASLAALRRSPSGLLREVEPDIVVFDESFVNRDVPFGAFTAYKTLYELWNRPGKTTFHSTTYQPNTISSLHFLRCLEKEDPEFHAVIADDLELIQNDPTACGTLFAHLYSPSLYRATRSAGCAVPVRATGSYVTVGGRRIFDGVSGVACSIRGHNPLDYVREIGDLPGVCDCEEELTQRLHALTGLEHVLPAVSGASAVESALKLALVAQFPKRHVLALKAGFGGKTLFALTGTWNTAYKEHIEPLYADVTYVDPWAADAVAQIEAALAKYPVAVVQVELIQAVGGVRRVPEAVIRHLEARRQHYGYLLLVDEVQTGMYRTGPFTLSRSIGLTPDLLILGKGTSDMMFPFALVLYTPAVQERLDRAGSGLPAGIRQRHGYEFGYRTVLNVLRRAEELRLAERVSDAGAEFARLLGDELAGCKAVREVRVFGLLIGIELETRGWPRRWFRKRLYLLSILAMLHHARYPVLIGYCQYEPNILKFTPPLTVTPAEIRAVCATIGEVLKRPFHRLVASALGGWMSAIGKRNLKHDHRKRAVNPAHESAGC
jgi:acetylornithine/succinyldiaminopimelate/putrescine aminotransferase